MHLGNIVVLEHVSPFPESSRNSNLISYADACNLTLRLRLSNSLPTLRVDLPSRGGSEGNCGQMFNAFQHC